MIQNYIKTAWRNIRKNRGFSVLNIIGLTIGITCFLLLGAYIVHETNYDRFLPHADRVAYVSFAYKSPNDSKFVHNNTTPTAVAPTLEKEFAEITKAVRLYVYDDGGLIQAGSQQIKEGMLRYADDGFFDVLRYSFMAGDQKTALQKPYQMVLTQGLADKYFPDSAPIGQTLLLDGQPWKVSGVIPNPPSYSQVQFSAILSNKHLSRYNEPVWHSANDVTFALLKDQGDIPAVEEKANAYIRDLFQDVFKNGHEFKVKIEALPEVHLHSEIGTGNILYVYTFGALAIAIMIITCVNFTNLSLAHATERAKEIGVKKVLGASRSSLFYSFRFECGMIVSIALALAICIAHFLLPLFAYYIGTTIELAVSSTALFYIGVFLFAVLISLLAGSWPALVISAFKPTQSLKGTILGHKRGFGFGNSLIVFQFSISALFIICTLVTTRQLHYIQTKDTGLNRSQIVVLDGDMLSRSDQNTLKNKLLEQGSIASVTASYDSPVDIKGGYTLNRAEGKSADFNLSVTAIPIEKDFVSTFEIPTLAGDPLTDSDILRAQDTADTREYAFIVNQQLTEALQWTPATAIGKSISLNGRSGKIKTVVQDFNFASLKEEIQPVILFPEYDYFGNIFVKVAPHHHMTDALATIRSSWQSVKPNTLFNYHFLNEDFAKLYRLEQQTSKTMLLFSVVTIGIACMGLFALAAFQAQQRIKEVGIRKVLGASVGKIIMLLTADFVKMVGIALVIAAPIGWWLMYSWLGNFAYRINVEWWIFAVAGIITIGITYLTVGGQAFRAARSNPVKSLRDE